MSVGPSTGPAVHQHAVNDVSAHDVDLEQGVQPSEAVVTLWGLLPLWGCGGRVTPLTVDGTLAVQ